MHDWIKKCINNRNWNERGVGRNNAGIEREKKGVVTFTRIKFSACIIARDMYGRSIYHAAYLFDFFMLSRSRNFVAIAPIKTTIK